MLDVNPKLLAHGALYLRNHQNGLDPLLADLIADEMEKVVTLIKAPPHLHLLDPVEPAPAPAPAVEVGTWGLDPAPAAPAPKRTPRWQMSRRERAAEKNKATLAWLQQLGRPFSVAEVSRRTSGSTILYKWSAKGLVRRVGVGQFEMVSK